MTSSLNPELENGKPPIQEDSSIFLDAILFIVLSETENGDICLTAFSLRFISNLPFILIVVSLDVTFFALSLNSSSVSGVMYDSSGMQYTLSCSGFSIPRYRLSNSSGYQYQDLNVKVYDSNLSVARAFPSTWRMDNGWYYLVIAFLGVILVCLMRYKRC